MVVKHNFYYLPFLTKYRSSNLMNNLMVDPIRRTTKEKDRVEIDAVDLATASQKAENACLRVVGRYHSHPHITFHPSHIDLSTQYSYQAHCDPQLFWTHLIPCRHFWWIVKTIVNVFVLSTMSCSTVVNAHPIGKPVGAGTGCEQVPDSCHHCCPGVQE